MISKKLIKGVTIFLISLCMISCGINKIKIADKATGPKELYVNLSSDPLLITIELKTILESKGYKVALSTEESAKEVTIHADSNTETTYKNVSSSNNRYELILGYQPIQDRIKLIVASVRDREKNKILGTWRWSWSQMIPAPTIEGAIYLVEENLLAKVFE
ncbi:MULTISPECIES: hypothetical protein [unclassified Oleiphilus]|uniref:hypothetical protein n=2 Tax=Oleiphilus TaxID=141450 RepID=UPI0007C20200|nr:MULTISPECIES: hypothetical protein [unclassified Oleiphilus]KZY37731.1 hypothetical protein A3729_16410 [Oleiphilus sp. HI0043]KZZ67912.1 hypothetical protein A3763_15255 [Oleiphilus sp. HI0128]